MKNLITLFFLLFLISCSSDDDLDNCEMCRVLISESLNHQGSDSEFRTTFISDWSNEMCGELLTNFKNQYNSVDTVQANQSGGISIYRQFTECE